MQSQIYFHAERLGFIAANYPRSMLQKQVDNKGIWFEVHNITEANRVRFLDEEKEFLYRILAEINPQDNFYDIGASIGLVALHVSRHCNSVYAFEPDPGFRTHLERNVKINDIQNLTVLPYAISDMSTKLTLFTNGVGGKSPSLLSDGFHSGMEVPARTLSDLIYLDHMPFPSVIKIDIEGAESLALRGMGEFLAKNPPRLIFLEMHPDLLPRFDSSTEDILQMLIQSGYRIKSGIPRDKQIHYTLEFNSTSLDGE